MSQIRVLLLTTCYPSHEGDPSGVFVAKLAAAIEKRGCSLTVLAPSDGTCFGRRMIDDVDTYRFGYFWPRSMLRLTKGSGGIPENMARSWLARLQVFPMMAFFFYQTLCRIHRYDIIYANWLGAGIIGAMVNLLTGTPMVVSFRGDDGYMARDRFFWRLLAKWVSRRSGMVAPVSKEILEILARLGVESDKLALPRFGVDTEMFHPDDATPLDGDRPQVVFVGSVIAKKGPQDLLEAMADPSFHNTRLVFVGDGESRPHLEEMCERLRLSDRVEWRGTRSPMEVAEILRCSDVLCLPSYLEGKPNVIKEAMASGLPVVAACVGGIPELVEDGETGLLFTPGNVEELRECLRRVIADKGMRSRMGMAGYDRIHREGINWRSTADDFHTIFNRLMEQAA